MPAADIKLPGSPSRTARKSGKDREAIIPTDYTLIAIVLAALVGFWLVFSLVRKIFGLVLLAAIALGGWVLWSNPQMLQLATDAASRFFSW